MRLQSPIITGYVLSLVIVVVLLVDATVTVFEPSVLQAEMVLTGFPMRLSIYLGAIEAIIAIVYAIPRTAVCGAILGTGFFGGAICTHFRLGEIGSPPQVMAGLLAILTWAGLWLRDPRVRELIPCQSTSNRDPL